MDLRPRRMGQLLSEARRTAVGRGSNSGAGDLFLAGQEMFSANLADRIGVKVPACRLLSRGQVTSRQKIVLQFRKNRDLGQDRKVGLVSTEGQSKHGSRGTL